MNDLIKLPPPRLPGWRPRAELSRPTAEQINAGENRNQTLTVAGVNEVIPIVYGEQITAGPLIAGPVVSGAYVVYAVAVCWAGERGIEQILDARVGDAITALPAIATPATGRQVGDWWVYDGRQTAPNPWLAAAIPGFTDIFTGVAYVAARFSTGATSWPQPSFRVRGRRCYDPRTGLATWTENPVLHLLDFVSNTEFGMGVELRGAAAAADVADSLYSGLPRSRSSLVIQDAAPEDEILPLLAGYAELIWGYDGADIVGVPDVPADVIHEIPGGHIRHDSISLSTVDLAQIPTLVQVMFTDRSTPEGWTSRPARAEAPEHTLHGAYTSVSSVSLPGVYNRIHAERLAWQRLLRLQAPGRIQWQMTSPGMAYQAGDVVRLPDVNGLRSVDVRITAQPEMIAPGFWQMAGELYSASHYPTDGGGTVVPVGAILILRGNGAVPAGWEAYSAGNGRLLREGAPGAAGTLTAIARTYTSGAAGGHTGTYKPGSVFQIWGAGWPDLEGGFVYHSADTPVTEPDHTHQFGLSLAIAPALAQRRVRLVRKTGTPALLAPGLAFLAAGEIAQLGVVESAGLQGGYLGADAAEQSTNATAAVALTCSVKAAHTHSDVPLGRVRVYPNYPDESADMGVPAGAHAHDADAQITARLRSIALAVYEAVSDPLLPAGAIVGWESGAIPAGWALCDGADGTPDLRDRFIYVTSAAAAGAEHHADSMLTIRVGSSRDAPSHQHVERKIHRAPLFPNPRGVRHPDQQGGHRHTINASEDVDISNLTRYQLRFIIYRG